MKPLLTLVFAVVLIAGVTVWELDAFSKTARIERAIEELRRRLMQTITSNWKSGGVDMSVSTTRGSNEPVDEWLARHDAAVTAAKAKFPPDA